MSTKSEKFKRWLPPAVVEGLRKRGWVGVSRWRGDYARWPDAVAASGGYDDPRVVQQAIAAGRAVEAGQAPWERDGVTQSAPWWPWPVVAALLRAAGSRQRLAVIDLGGGAGSTWRQVRGLLGSLEVSWRVVEQASVVEAARGAFRDPALSFHATLADAVDGGADLALASGSLQYLEPGLTALAGLRLPGVRHLVLDRTPFHEGPVDRLLVQHVAGGASYPCWFFARASLARVVAQVGGVVVAQWPSDEPQVFPGATLAGALIDLPCAPEPLHVP